MDATPRPESPVSLLSYTGKKVPLVLQSEMSECGLACLAMVLGFYGYETDMTTLRKRFGISGKGVHLKHLMEVASRCELVCRALKADTEDLHKIKLPCVVHWDMNHFVVVKSIRKNKIVILDPASGEQSLSIEDCGKHYTGIALELYPTSNFRKGKEKKRLKLKHFWNEMSGLKRSLVQVLALSFVLQLFSVIAPLYMQIVIDDVILREDVDLLVVLALGFGLLMLVDVGVSTLRQFVILHLSTKLSVQMASNLFRHLIRLPLDFFAKRHMGDVVSRFGSLASIRDLLTTGVVSAVVDGVMAIIMLIAMFMYTKTLTLLVIGVVAIYALVRWLLYRPFRILSEESLVAGAKENSHFMESIRSIQTIKIFQKENFRQNQWHNKLADSVNKDIKIAKWSIGYGVINSILFGVENILIVFLAAKLVIGDVLSVGMLYAFMSYKNRFVGSMDGLISQWIELKMMELHLSRLSDIAFSKKDSAVDEVESVGWGGDDDVREDPKTAIRIDVVNLAFKYGPMEDYVFKNINFSVEAHQSVAIVGPSGCGKTTLMKCMMGLLKPTKGDIFINGVSIKKMAGYRSLVSSVMQDDQLISGDIADNISCFDSHVDMDRVVESAKKACIHNEIMNMPMQYRSLIGDMGDTLSGGQRQRVMLARALYSNPSVLFLDEATSNLDIKNEKIITANVSQLNCTRIMAAHRPETIESADKVVNVG